MYPAEYFGIQENEKISELRHTHFGIMPDVCITFFDNPDSTHLESICDLNSGFMYNDQTAMRPFKNFFDNSLIGRLSESNKFVALNIECEAEIADALTLIQKAKDNGIDIVYCQFNGNTTSNLYQRMSDAAAQAGIGLLVDHEDFNKYKDVFDRRNAIVGVVTESEDLNSVRQLMEDLKPYDIKVIKRLKKGEDILRYLKLGIGDYIVPEDELQSVPERRRRLAQNFPIFIDG